MTAHKIVIVDDERGRFKYDEVQGATDNPHRGKQQHEKHDEDEPDELVHDLFADLIWNGHALGRSILGTAELIGGVTEARQYVREALRRRPPDAAG